MRRLTDLTLGRRGFLSGLTAAGLASIGLQAASPQPAVGGGRVGDIVLQPVEGGRTFYLTVAHDPLVPNGDLICEGYEEGISESTFRSVQYQIKAGLMGTARWEERTVAQGQDLDPSRPHVFNGKLGLSTQWEVRSQSFSNDTGLFYGRLTVHSQGQDFTAGYFYRDFEPFPIVLVIIVVGAAVLLCQYLQHKEYEDCLKQARDACGAMGVKNLKVKRVFGLKEDGGWDVGCTVNCEFDCMPKQ